MGITYFSIHKVWLKFCLTMIPAPGKANFNLLPGRLIHPAQRRSGLRPALLRPMAGKGTRTEGNFLVCSRINLPTGILTIVEHVG